MDPYPITTLDDGDPAFPSSLTATTGTPERLYVRGSLAALARPHRLAVVGTRQMTAYGEQAITRLIRPVVAHDIVVISGLALGIDAAAHRACLDAGGTTIAVLGSGIDDDTIGPRSNLRLAHDILEHDGLLVSEYAPGTPADRWTFPARNRIISALSQAVLVIEAAKKSGALITARCAAEQGRDVLAVPGGIFWSHAAGPNLLIRDGAKPVTEPSDIIEVFGLTHDTSKRAVSTRNPAHARIAAILEHGPSSVDALAQTLELSTTQVLTELSLMEVDGLVNRNQDGTYILI